MKEKFIAGLFLIFLFTPLEAVERQERGVGSLTGFTGSSFAQVTVKAEVDKTKITSDEAITYKLSIVSFEENIPRPQIPEFKGFNIVSQSESSSVSFAKSKVKVAIVYAFILSPVDVGKFNIEPSVIKIKDKIYATDSFEIEVTPGKKKPFPVPKQKPSLPEKPVPETEEPQVTL